MELTLTRLNDNGISTLGSLGVDKLLFYTIEDTYRAKKVWGKTRIPSGRYEIKLRTEGKKHEQYKKKYSFHKGMLELQNVPGFKNILIHVGNTAIDSSGCVLVATDIIDENNVSGSIVAYIKLYLHVIKAFNRNEQVYINIIDNA
jgi:hypothetical protein